MHKHYILKKYACKVWLIDIWKFFYLNCILRAFEVERQILTHILAGSNSVSAVSQSGFGIFLLSFCQFLTNFLSVSYSVIGSFSLIFGSFSLRFLHFFSQFLTVSYSVFASFFLICCQFLTPLLAVFHSVLAVSRLWLL